MCTNPITGWQFYPGQKLIFRRDKAVNYFRNNLANHTQFIGDEELKPFEMLVPCGACFECLESASIEWAYRIMDEAKLHDKNCVVTLTYAVEPPELIKKDYQDFIKRLRWHLSPVKIRTFVSGEYGTKGTKRPHFHIILFGWFPDDVKFHHTNKKGNPVFTSPFIEKIWGKGFISVDMLDFETAKYSAKYLQKQLSGDAKYNEKQPPFITMSNRPGIGVRTVSADSIFTDKIYNSGRSRPLPRYYLKLLDRQGLDVEPVKDKRRNNAKLRVVDKKYLEIKHFSYRNYLT